MPAQNPERQRGDDAGRREPGRTGTGRPATGGGPARHDRRRVTGERGRVERRGRADQPRGTDDRRRPRSERREEPPLPEDVEPQMLDRAARAALRGLTKDNADAVARHLVMAGRLLDDDPETAHAHAQAAVRRAGRIDVVREAAALTAYAVGNYAEALRELRTVRRLSGIDAHRAIEADCERGLGRPERALAIVNSTDATSLAEADRAELAIVASGARADLGEYEAGLLVLDSSLVAPVRSPELLHRLALVRADRLAELGRTAEAEAERRRAAALAPDDLEIVVLDLGEDEPARASGAPVPERTAAAGPAPHEEAARPAAGGPQAKEQG